MVRTYGSRPGVDGNKTRKKKWIQIFFSNNTYLHKIIRWGTCIFPALTILSAYGTSYTRHDQLRHRNDNTSLQWGRGCKSGKWAHILIVLSLPCRPKLSQSTILPFLPQPPDWLIWVLTCYSHAASFTLRSHDKDETIMGLNDYTSPPHLVVSLLILHTRICQPSHPKVQFNQLLPDLTHT